MPVTVRKASPFGLTVCKQDIKQPHMTLLRSPVRSTTLDILLVLEYYGDRSLSSTNADVPTQPLKYNRCRTGVRFSRTDKQICGFNNLTAMPRGIETLRPKKAIQGRDRGQHVYQISSFSSELYCFERRPNKDSRMAVKNRTDAFILF